MLISSFGLSAFYIFFFYHKQASKYISRIPEGFRMAILKKEITGIDKNMKKLESLYMYTGGGNGKHCGKEFEVFKKIKHMIWQLHSYVYTQTTRSRFKQIFVHDTSTHWSIIHSSQKVETTQVLPTDEWVNKMWYSHAVE